MIDADFLNTYATLGSGIAAFGGPDWSADTPGKPDGRYGSALVRDKKKGSPVVPGSHVRILAEGDYVMFSITILRGQTEAGKYEGDVFVAGIYIISQVYHASLYYIYVLCTKSQAPPQPPVSLFPPIISLPSFSSLLFSLAPISSPHSLPPFSSASRPLCRLCGASKDCFQREEIRGQGVHVRCRKGWRAGRADTSCQCRGAGGAHQYSALVQGSLR